MLKFVGLDTAKRLEDGRAEGKTFSNLLNISKIEFEGLGQTKNWIGGRADAQCDQIGRFLKVTGTNLVTKIAKIFLRHLRAIVKNGTFYVELLWILLGNFCRKLGYFSIHLVTLLLLLQEVEREKIRKRLITNSTQVSNCQPGFHIYFDFVFSSTIPSSSYQIFIPLTRWGGRRRIFAEISLPLSVVTKNKRANLELSNQVCH